MKTQSTSCMLVDAVVTIALAAKTSMAFSPVVLSNGHNHVKGGMIAVVPAPAVQSVMTSMPWTHRHHTVKKTELCVSLDPRDVSPPKEEEHPAETTKPSPVVNLAASPLGAIAVLAFVILFHESGHYLAAKSFGVAVDEFSVGWGPKLFGFGAMGGDAFSLRALPVGGYVSINVASLHTLPWWSQVEIMSAGVQFNLLLALLVYTSQFMSGQGLAVPVFDEGALVTGVEDDFSPAKGLLAPGDVVEAVNGKAVLAEPTSSEMQVHRAISTLIDEVHATPNGLPIKFSVRDPKTGKVRNVKVTPQRRNPQDKPTVGVFLFPNYVGRDVRKSKNPLEASAFAASMVATLFSETAIGLVTFARDFLSGKASSSEYHISGPVASSSVLPKSSRHKSGMSS